MIKILKENTERSSYKDIINGIVRIYGDLEREGITGVVSNEEMIRRLRAYGVEASYLTEPDWDFIYDKAYDAALATEEDTLVINGYEFYDESDAKRWLEDKLEEYGNTRWFSAEDKNTLNKLISKFGNTKFWH